MCTPTTPTHIHTHTHTHTHTHVHNYVFCCFICPTFVHSGKKKLNKKKLWLMIFFLVPQQKCTGKGEQGETLIRKRKQSKFFLPDVINYLNTFSWPIIQLIILPPPPLHRRPSVSLKLIQLKVCHFLFHFYVLSLWCVSKCSLHFCHELFAFRTFFFFGGGRGGCCFLVLLMTCMKWTFLAVQNQDKD